VKKVGTFSRRIRHEAPLIYDLMSCIAEKEKKKKRRERILAS
jgi:Txe/YoeB family toxin of Txe-Axe toxin-antitoxin module